MIRRLLLVFFAVFLFSACGRMGPEHASPGSEADSGVRNVILMIGDGMGPQQVGLLVMYAHHAPHSVYASKGGRTALERIIEAGTLGYARHEPADALVTDSGASSTQMASGQWARAERIGIDRNGRPVKTILEIAEEMGKSTGLVTDTGITHATPAGFAAHRTHRSKQDAIAVDLLEGKVDVMLGGGLEWWIPRHRDGKAAADEPPPYPGGIPGDELGIESKRKDDRNLLEEARAMGYALCLNRVELEGAAQDRILGLFGPTGLMNGIQETRTKEDPNRRIPTLREMTAKALDVLSRNPRGFFLMVEAGRIDWAGHDNDTGTLLHEMIKFDETIAHVHEWVRARRDTLLLVTADHETGGFGFSCIPNERPAPRTLPGAAFQGEVFQPQNRFGEYGILDRIYNQKLSYEDMMDRFDALPMERQTPKALAEMIDENTDFPISEAQAAAILGLGLKDSVSERKAERGVTPEGMDADRAFFPAGKEGRAARLARIVSKDQMTVWATGMHTSTPVPLIALGPAAVSSRYGKMMHTTEWGRQTIEILSQGK